MANGEMLRFPQASIAMGNGDLVEVTDFNVDFSNGAKVVHLLRRSGAGVVIGVRECTVTFNAPIDEDGPKRNYWKDCEEGTIRQIRAKVPGGTTVLVVNGVYSKVTLDGPLDDATKVSCTFIGRLEKPSI